MYHNKQFFKTSNVNDKILWQGLTYIFKYYFASFFLQFILTCINVCNSSILLYIFAIRYWSAAVFNVIVNINCWNKRNQNTQLAKVKLFVLSFASCKYFFRKKIRNLKTCLHFCRHRRAHASLIAAYGMPITGARVLLIAAIRMLVTSARVYKLNCRALNVIHKRARVRSVAAHRMPVTVLA